jgi:hypothetical protein
LNQLVLPTARDIRSPSEPSLPTIRLLRPGANTGKPVQVRVRRESTAETGLFADFSLAKKIRGIYLQPDPPPVIDGTISQLLFQRTTGATPRSSSGFSQQLGTDHKGLTLVGKKGERSLPVAPAPSVTRWLPIILPSPSPPRKT